jgi:hypothetical protein
VSVSASSGSGSSQSLIAVRDAVPECGGGRTLYGSLPLRLCVYSSLNAIVPIAPRPLMRPPSCEAESFVRRRYPPYAQRCTREIESPAEVVAVAAAEAAVEDAPEAPELPRGHIAGEPPTLMTNPSPTEAVAAMTSSGDGCLRLTV